MPDATGACEACYRTKERCQLDRHQQSCSRCSRLGKTCHPRTKKRFGRPPIVKKFAHGTSGLLSFSSTSSDPQPGEVVARQPSQPDRLDRTAFKLPDQGTFTESTWELSSKSQTPSGPELVLRLIHGIHTSSHKQVEHVLTTKDGFFHLHRHWLIAKSLSSNYQHTVRRLFSHAPLILAEAYHSILELFSSRDMELRGLLKTPVDFTRGAKCLGVLIQSSGSLRSVEDAAVVLMLGQILFIYNVLISWPCTHLIIRNTLLTTRKWYPAMLKAPEWDPATLTPVFVDTIQCLVGREVPVLRLLVEDRVVVDRFLGVSSSLLPLLYDICVCSHRIKTHAPAPQISPFSIDTQEANDDAYSTIERQIRSWKPVLPPEFFAKYTHIETSALLAQARMYKTAGLILIHRLRHPLGVHDETGKCYAESIFRDLSSYARSIRSRDASGIGSNFLLLLATLELPERGNSLMQALEPFRFGPKNYIQIMEFAKYVRVQRDCGFDGLWFDLAEDGLFGVALP